MTIEFSFLSSMRSVLGIEVQRSGAINRDENNKLIFQSTFELTIGFLFGYLSLHFEFGRPVGIEDMVTKYKELKNKIYEEQTKP